MAIARQPHNDKRNASVSCEADPQKISPLPAAFVPSAPARPCTIAMTRYKLDWPFTSSSTVEDLKIEYWVFKPTAKEARALIEVSWKASLSDADAQKFREAIAPLQDKLQAIPPPGKEQTALACDANWPA